MHPYQPYPALGDRARALLVRLAQVIELTEMAPSPLVIIAFGAPNPFDGVEDEVGSYMPPTSEEGDHGLVVIYRMGIDPEERPGAEGAASATNPLRELMWLAHELGHHRSWLERTHPPHCKSKGLRCLYCHQKDQCYAEEVRAWDHAARMLEPGGFDDWLAFGEERRRCLGTYQRAFAMEEETAVAVCETCLASIERTAIEQNLDDAARAAGSVEELQRLIDLQSLAGDGGAEEWDAPAAAASPTARTSR